MFSSKNCLFYGYYIFINREVNLYSHDKKNVINIQILLMHR